MFDYFALSPKIEEKGSYYLVSGINLRDFEADLRTNFGTSVIFSRVVNRVNGRQFRFHKFFSVELCWILDHLVNGNDRRSISRYRVGLHKYKLLLDELKTDTWIKSIFEKHPQYDVDKALKEFNYPPFPDQRNFLEQYSSIKYGYQLRGCLLDAAAGSGKTYTSMVWSTMISEGKTIVIVPKHLVNKPWVDEVTSKHFRNPRKCWTTLDKTSYLDNLDADYFVIHKDALRSGEFMPLVKAITKGGKIPAKVIVDECHNYNEPNSQQTRALIELCSDPAISDVLFMSGTPIKAQGRETFALFTIIDKYFDRYVRDDFLKMYGRDNAFLNEMLAHRLGQVKYTIAAIKEMDAPPEPEIIKVSFPGCENFTLENIRVAMMEFIKDRIDYYRKMMPRYLSDFHNFLEDYEMDIRYDEDAQAELKKYRLIVDRFHRKGYNNFTDSEDSKFCKTVENRIEEGLRGEDLKYFRHIKSAVKYVNLKIRGEALGNVLGKARMAAVRETIRHARLPELINSVKKKTVLYTSYVEVIKELERYFEELEEFRPISVFGENSKEVDQVIKKIESDKTINPLITTFNTLREGYPLLFANQIIMLNSPFRSFELTQTIARIHRRGQDEECFVKLIDLDTGDKENITSRTINIMEWSQNQIDVLLGGGNLSTIDSATMNGLIGAESLGTDGKFDYFKFKEHFDLECEETPNHYPKFKPKTNLSSIF